jgi:hypothetical protein
MKLLIMAEQWPTSTAFVLFLMERKRVDEDMLLHKVMTNYTPRFIDMLRKLSDSTLLGLEPPRDSLLEFLRKDPILKFQHLKNFECILFNKDYAVQECFETCHKDFFQDATFGGEDDVANPMISLEPEDQIANPVGPGGCEDGVPNGGA